MADKFPDGIRTGRINYKNFLKRFLDLGFNNADCVSELIDNAIDAGAKTIQATLVSKVVDGSAPEYYLEILDDGIGMDESAFAKYFEMFGDKDDATLQSLGKKGIGGKVALATLSRLEDTVVISRRKNSDLLYSKVSWKKLTEAGNICINHASKYVEDLWDTSCLCSSSSGTIARIYLSRETHEELDELISREDINDRNIYYIVCRNYFRHLCDGISITFTKHVNQEQLHVMKCLPLDPLHLDKIESPIYMAEDALSLYINPENKQVVLLVKDEVGNMMGYSQNKALSHKMKPWTHEDIKALQHVGNIVLQHSYILYEEGQSNKNINAPLQTLKESHILQNLFVGTKFTKESIATLTGGTHLERNRKETGLLLDPRHKRSGDFDKREFFNQSRHRLIFTCTSDNEALMDTIFRTQINKSKVDINEIPKIVYKTIERLNENFSLKVYDAVWVQTPLDNSLETVVKYEHNVKTRETVAPKKLSLEYTQTPTQTPLVSNTDSFGAIHQTAQNLPAPTYSERVHTIKKDSKDLPTEMVVNHPSELQSPTNTNACIGILEIQKEPQTLNSIPIMSERVLLHQLRKLAIILVDKDIQTLELLCDTSHDESLVPVANYFERLYDRIC